MNKWDVKSKLNFSFCLAGYKLLIYLSDFTAELFSSQLNHIFLSDPASFPLVFVVNKKLYQQNYFYIRSLLTFFVIFIPYMIFIIYSHSRLFTLFYLFTLAVYGSILAVPKSLFKLDGFLTSRKLDSFLVLGDVPHFISLKCFPFLGGEQ